ncbi:MAG: ABC transporter permease [Propionibacteriaceae bacterium]|nr:ABC transporter permease [Propionibacteriaceae bacterium]
MTSMITPSTSVRPTPGQASLVTEVALLTQRRARELLREPQWIVSGLATPILYLVLFAPLLKDIPSPLFGGLSVVQMFVPGMLVLFAFGSGQGIGWTVIHELDTGVIERFRVSPVRRVSLLLGSVIRDGLFFIACALVVCLVAVPFGFVIHPLGLILTLLLLALLTGCVSAMSAALGLTLKNIGALAASVMGMQLPLTLLAGALLPISMGPTWLQVLAHLDPFYYAVSAARDLSSGVILSGTVGLGFLVVIALFLLVLAWASRVYRHAVA